MKKNALNPPPKKSKIVYLNPGFFPYLKKYDVSKWYYLLSRYLNVLQWHTPIQKSLLKLIDEEKISHSENQKLVGMDTDSTNLIWLIIHTRNLQHLLAKCYWAVIYISVSFIPGLKKM